MNSKGWAAADAKNQMRTHRIRQYVHRRYPAGAGSLTLQLFSYDFNSKYSTNQKKKITTYKTYKNWWLNGPLEGYLLWYRNLKTQCKEVYFICTHKWLKRKVYCPSPDGSSHNFTSLFSIERKVAFGVETPSGKLTWTQNYVSGLEMNKFTWRNPLCPHAAYPKSLFRVI